MDPNETLAGIRSKIHTMMDDVEPDVNDVVELFEKFAALDEWLTRGGFLPADWARKG